MGFDLNAFLGRASELRAWRGQLPSAVVCELGGDLGMVPVTGRPFLDQLSWLMPSRWGYAASASTVDVRLLVPGSLVQQDSHWAHTPGAWLLDMGMLAVLAVLCAVIVRWRLRLKR